MIEPCRLPAEGAGQPRLAGSGLAGDDQVLMPLHRPTPHTGNAQRTLLAVMLGNVNT